MDALVAKELRDATGSDILFDTADGVIASTLNERATAVTRANLLRTKETDLVSDGVHKYAWVRQSLLDISHNKVAEICILRSFEGAEHRIAGLSTTILLLWLVAMCAGMALTYLLPAASWSRWNNWTGPRPRWRARITPSKWKYAAKTRWAAWRAPSTPCAPPSGRRGKS
ncbi:hypothetical protein SBA3_2710017 [Candidatus Sulfopaludibacter sp. SbA3]|nr:hypothetical protein SBA3_2710017 [Candidatus Sulfopaludibacter sp. SbA3]